VLSHQIVSILQHNSGVGVIQPSIGVLSRLEEDQGRIRIKRLRCNLNRTGVVIGCKTIYRSKIELHDDESKFNQFNRDPRR
jgi:hypothetical protein